MGSFLVNLRVAYYDWMTGPEYYYSATGYYWSLDSVNEALTAAEWLDGSNWEKDGNEKDEKEENDTDKEDFDWYNITASSFNVTALLSFLDDPSNNPAAKAWASHTCSTDELVALVTESPSTTRCNPFVEEPHGCPPGLFYNTTAHSSAPCPPGFFCPGSFKCIVPCVYGASCLPSVTTPSVSSDSTCREPLAYGGDSEGGVLVEDGTVMCPGRALEKLCPAGFYCKAPDSDPVVCASGHYCPKGSVVMTECVGAFQVCEEEGMVRPRYTASSSIIFGCAAAALVFAVFLFAFRKDRKRRRDLTASAPVRAKGADLLPNLTEKGELRMDVAFDKMGLKLNGSKKKVLNSVTGTVKAGRITAAMGPSGAGKTTFMNVLAGKASYGITTGRITINGGEEDVMEYSELCGFVPQDDTMMRDMTVHENLAFYARMRLPSTTSNAKCDEITRDVINTLGLSHVQHEPIGDETTRGISGGQRKRVNVGMEMVSSPSLLFLDEPTSGLDSATSYELLEALKELAKKGTNIVVVLHQPSWQLFQLFDDVLLLGKGGSTVYLGPSGDAQSYFDRMGFTCPQRVNPADFFIDVIAGKYERKNYGNFKPVDLFDMWIDQQKNGGSRAAAPEPGQRITMAALEKVAPIGFTRSFVMYASRSVLQYNKHKLAFLSDVVMQVSRLAAHTCVNEKGDGAIR